MTRVGERKKVVSARQKNNPEASQIVVLKKSQRSWRTKVSKQKGESRQERRIHKDLNSNNYHKLGSRVSLLTKGVLALRDGFN